MKFSETRAEMTEFIGAETAEYQMQYLAAEVIDTISNLENRFVEYLTDDIMSRKNDVNLKEYLGNKYYGPSNNNAKECLEICLTIKHIYGRRVKGWTDSALKCYDNFLLHFIQEIRKESVKTNLNVGREREVYHHLIDLGGQLQEIGQAFDNIYQERNEFHHVQIIDRNGIRSPNNLSNAKFNQKRDLILGWFRQALEKLLQIMK